MTEITFENPVPNSQVTENSPGYRNNCFMPKFDGSYWYSSGKNLLIYNPSYSSPQIVAHADLETSEYVWMFGACEDLVLGIITGGSEDKLISYDVDFTATICPLGTNKVQAAIVHDGVVMLSCISFTTNYIVLHEFNCNEIGGTVLLGPGFDDLGFGDPGLGYGYGDPGLPIPGLGYGYGDPGLPSCTHLRYNYTDRDDLIGEVTVITDLTSSAKIIGLGVIADQFFGIMVNFDGTSELVALDEFGSGRELRSIASLPTAPAHSPTPMVAKDYNLYFVGLDKVMAYDSLTEGLADLTSLGLPVATPDRNFTSLSISDAGILVGFDGVSSLDSSLEIGSLPEPVIVPPPMSFDLSLVSFDPNNTAETIITTSNPSYTGPSTGSSSGSSSGSGSGSSLGNGSGSINVGSLAAPMAISGTPSAFYDWVPCQCFHAFGSFYLFAYNKGNVNDTTKPYSKRVILYRINSAANAFEYLDVPGLLDYVYHNTDSMKSRSRFGLKEYGDEVIAAFAAIERPFGTTVDGEDVVLSFHFKSDGSVLFDHITESQVIAQTNYTNPSFYNSNLLMWQDLGGRPYHDIAGSRSGNDRIKLITTVGGNKFYCDNLSNTTILAGNSYFADDENNGSATNGRFDISRSITTTIPPGYVVADREKVLNLFSGVDDVNPVATFNINTIDYELTLSTSNLGHSESIRGSSVLLMQGNERDENFENPTNKRMYLHKATPASVPTINFEINMDYFGTWDSSKQIFSTTSQYTNEAGYILTYSSPYKKYHYATPGAEFAVELTSYLTSSLGMSLASTHTDIVDSPYGFMRFFCSKANLADPSAVCKILFIQPGSV